MPAIKLQGLGAPTLPLQRGNKGYFSFSHGSDVIDASIRDIISTAPKERVMRPSYGCRIHELPFEQADDVTLALFKRYVLDAVSQFEKRVSVKGASATFDQTDPDRPLLVGSVSYTLRGDSSQQILGTDFSVVIAR
jgi:phage baseplate assembly protein W